MRGEGETTPEKPVREGSDSENPVPGDYISEDYVPEDHFHGPGKKIHRRLYDWVLHWADTPQGPQALGFLSWIESFIFPIPPDPLLMALCLGAPKKALRFAAITTVASMPLRPSITAIGRPTRKDLPTTTARAPVGSMP